MQRPTKFPDRNIAIALATQWRDDRQDVVFTNGCFDILHAGHVTYLQKAKEMGQKLVIGLNTDRSVSVLKGPERPINNEIARATVLAALECVDLVILFDEQTPIELITELQPNVLVKGGDYSIDTIVGSDFVLKNGGKVETIDLLEGFSTSDVINRIKK